MDMKLKMLVLTASDQVPLLLHQVVLQQAHQVLLSTIVKGGHLGLFEMSVCYMT